MAMGGCCECLRQIHGLQPGDTTLALNTEQRDVVVPSGKRSYWRYVLLQRAMRHSRCVDAFNINKELIRVVHVKLDRIFAITVLHSKPRSELTCHVHTQCDTNKHNYCVQSSGTRASADTSVWGDGSMLQIEKCKGIVTRQTCYTSGCKTIM